MKKYKQYAIIFSVGGIFYSFLEVLWRGYTHWTMAITGGGCFLGVYLINIKRPHRRLALRCLDGSLLITAVELIVGCIVNRVLRWNVWDYSHMKFNVLGQICPLFSGIWFLLCFPGSALCRVLGELFEKAEPVPQLGKESVYNETKAP